MVLPQALRVALPPLTSEYLGIFKNSTLAVAIGYQDFMAVSTTMLTDTGQAMEVMAIVMAVLCDASACSSSAAHARHSSSAHALGPATRYVAARRIEARVAAARGPAAAVHAQALLQFRRLER